MLHNPILTVDTVIFHWNGEALRVLLEKRDRPPFEGAWALPGGFVHTNEDESLSAARDRILTDKVGIVPPYSEKVDSIGNATRDPRGWAVSVIYLGILKAEDRRPNHAYDHIKFVNVHEILNDEHDLAFDHVEIVRLAFQRLAVKCGYSTIPLQFMPPEFTFRMLLDIHRELMGVEPNKMSVDKRYRASEKIQPIIDPKTQKPKKISSPSGPNATVYRHNIQEPVNFAGVLGAL